MLVSVKKKIVALRENASPIRGSQIQVGDWLTFDYKSSKGPIVKGRIGVVEKIFGNGSFLMDMGGEGTDGKDWQTFKPDSVIGDILLIPHKD